MRSVFFTGATGGLGELCVRELSQRGWQVFAAGTNRQKLEELGKLPHVIPLYADVRSMDSLRLAREEIARHTDRVETVVLITKKND